MTTVNATIYYPISFETPEVLETIKKFGDVMAVPSNMDTREVTFKSVYEELVKLEEFFVVNEIPYDLMKYSKGVNAPTMKKYRPEQELTKEIPCTFYQNEEEEVEDGVVSVSTLLSILENSEMVDLKEKLLEEIKKSTFKFDNIENIFEM